MKAKEIRELSPAELRLVDAREEGDLALVLSLIHI